VKRATLLMASILGVSGLAAIVVLACAGSGCSSLGSLGYYSQAVGGHLEIVQRSKPVTQWLDDPATPAALRERLALSQRMRDFAVSELALPENRSYRSYADLQRSAVVWNVVATPELALTLKTWCFPVMGCVGYRGYFDRAGADAMAAELQREGLEVSVYGVPAYSTLGWTNWLGGDPLLNTFIRWPEGELARIVFHELAHQVVYVNDDTGFNESFATAVERIGGARWLATRASPAALGEYTEFDARRRDFRELTARHRERLRQLYTGPASDDDKRRRKAELMAQLQAEYATMKASRWQGFTGYDAWFARANNASFAVQAAYDELVPAFEALFENSGRDFPRFYAEVRRLAELPKAERRATLQKSTLIPSPTPAKP
jgi:predicted aminopeptidase